MDLKYVQKIFFYKNPNCLPESQGRLGVTRLVMITNLWNKPLLSWHSLDQNADLYFPQSNQSGKEGTNRGFHNMVTHSRLTGIILVHCFLKKQKTKIKRYLKVQYSLNSTFNSSLLLFHVYLVKQLREGWAVFERNGVQLIFLLYATKPQHFNRFR